MKYSYSNFHQDVKKACSTLRHEGFSSLTRKVIRRLSPGNGSINPGPKVVLSPIVQILPKNPALIESVGLTEESDFSLKLPLTDHKVLKFNQDFSIAAIVHIFYPDLTEKIFKYLTNIPFHIDIYITTDSEYKKEEISNFLVNHKLPFKEIRVLPNRGRDIAPMLLGCKDVLQDYQYILHLHSKKSPHGGDALSTWGEYCYRNLLGSKEIVQSIFYLLHKRNVGIVAPQHFPPLRGCINWGGDYDITRDILGKLGYKINSDTLIDFPSGSMFWANSEVLRKLNEVELKLEDFPVENKQVDGTLAHAIERSLFYVSEITGKRWVKVSTDTLSKTSIECSSSSFSSWLSNSFRPLSTDYVYRTNSVSNALSEIKKFTIHLDEEESRRRINLILNTVNPSNTFGGVASALNILSQFINNEPFNTDYRIIVLDQNLDNQAIEKFKDWKVIHQNSFNLDKKGTKIILECTNKLNDIDIRQNDFFIATAWWTALAAKELVEKIKFYFGVNNKFLYLIQDYESNFYNWSSKWLFAQSTYRGDNFIPLFNAEELANFFLQNNFISFGRYFYLPYKINTTLQKSLANDIKKEKRILLYSRPYVSRNAFEILIDGVDLWQRRCPTEAKQWEIVAIGQEFPTSWVNNILNVKVLGKLSLEEYSRLLNKSKIGISLMVSPHPSYPPLEMAYYGLQVITNRFSCKDLTTRSSNFICVDNCTPTEVADALELAVKRSDHFKPNKGLIQPTHCDGDVFSVQKILEIWK